MKADVEKKIPGRVAAAFADILGEISSSARSEILQSAQELVKAVWMGKIYAALPKDKTTIAEYFLDAELELFLQLLEPRAQLVLDLETARRCDVFEQNGAE